jgi:hypothetical protein
MNTQSPSPQPTFDPARSDAIRALLLQQVTAGSRHHRPSTRTAVVAALAVLATLVVGGTTAYALTGGELFGAPAPVATTPAATPPPQPTATPTPTPTSDPTPTTPPAPGAPVVRVPATCDELLPQSMAEQMAGTALQPLVASSPADPLGYTDERVGSLICAWSTDPSAGYGPDVSSVSLIIVPGTDLDDLTGEASREGVYISSPQLDIGSDAYAYCPSPGSWCGYIGQVGGYAIALSALRPAAAGEDGDTVRAPFIALRVAVSAFGAPEPLWQPSGTTLRGADACEELIDDTSLSTIVGEPVHLFRQYAHAGEYAASSFSASRQVSAFSCAWTPDRLDATANVRASVLPGGASYFARANAAHPEIGYAPVTGYPGDAYLSADGTQLSVLVDGGWVLVEAPAEDVPAMAEVVLGNVGAVGG